jgi:hypothetical protein
MQLKCSGPLCSGLIALRRDGRCLPYVCGAARDHSLAPLPRPARGRSFLLTGNDRPWFVESRWGREAGALVGKGGVHIMSTHTKSLGFVVVVFSHVTGCGGGNSTSRIAVDFPVLVFTDVHFNPSNDHTFFNTSEPDQWTGIFQSSAATTPFAYSQDTNYPMLALSGVRQKLMSAA